jgi:hypothetical protein
MAFNADNFIPLSGMANSNAARMFSYRTTDTSATVIAASYFDAAANPAGGYGLKDADIILCQQSAVRWYGYVRSGRKWCWCCDHRTN